MEKWVELGQEVRRFVNPATFPVAIKFLEETSLVPSSARRPFKE